MFAVNQYEVDAGKFHTECKVRTGQIRGLCTFPAGSEGRADLFQDTPVNFVGSRLLQKRQCTRGRRAVRVALDDLAQCPGGMYARQGIAVA